MKYEPTNLPVKLGALVLVKRYIFVVQYWKEWISKNRQFFCSQVVSHEAIHEMVKELDVNFRRIPYLVFLNVFTDVSVLEFDLMIRARTLGILK